MNQNPNEPSSSDTPWEEAMSRDFDARVRDLHEAPLDFTSVKGKARKIKRNRRAAVAGGVLGIAAIVTPVAVLSSSNDTDTQPPVVNDPTPSVADPAAGLDYVVDGVWHQADGDAVELRHDDYFGAVVWNGQLVATRTDGEVYAVADVVADDGSIVDTIPTTSAVVANDAGTTIAWIDTDGTVMTAWDGGQVSMGSVDLAAPGESVAYFTAAVTGGPNCYETEDGCTVYVNSGVGEPQVFDSHGVNDNPLPNVIEFSDATDQGLVSYVDKIENAGSCGGLTDLAGADELWSTCEYEAAQISPDSRYVIGLPSYYDGLGITEISVLDAADGTETGRYAAEGGFISQWAWSTDGQLVFDVYDGARWHLFSMIPAGGAFEEIGEPVEGEEFDSPFTLIQH